MYADDCVLYLSGNYWLSIRAKIQEDLDCFEHWGELNNLHLNVSKTKLLIVGTRSKLSRIGDVQSLILYDRPVSVVKQYNYLGVILDSEMSHFNHVKKNVYVKIFALSKLRSCLTEYAAIMMYKHAILPFLEYLLILLNFLICTRLKRELRDRTLNM